MDNENLLPEEARAVITQNGDRNIAVAHAENINITIVAPSPQDEQACHLVRWGDVEITHAEAKLFFEENLGAKKPVIKTGAEIPFTRYFYKYQQPTASEELEAKFMELEFSVSGRISELFG